MSLVICYPVERPRITQYFLERPEFYSRFGLPGHEGIDFGTDVGTPVLAVADGVVSGIETDPNKHAYGLYIRLRHTTPDGTFSTIYGHLSEINVAVDQQVRSRDVIGKSGNTGNSSGPHVHLSLKMPGLAAKGLSRYDDLINQRDDVVFLDDFLDPAYFFDTPTPRQSSKPRKHLSFAPQPVPVPDAPVEPAPVTPAQPIGVREVAPAPVVAPLLPPVEPAVEAVDGGPIQRPDHPLRGLHGVNAAHWMLQNGVRGWAVETIYADGDLTTPRPVDFAAHEAAGIRVIVRWNYSYAISDGGMGTFPTRDRHTEFIRWCVASIRASKGVWGHIVGNEPNRAAERPSWTEPITADDVVHVYNGVWNVLPKAVRASPPAIDPTNIETDDPRRYWRSIVSRIAGAEFFALHAYSYGSDQPLDSDERFGAPLSWQFHSFRMFETLANDLYSVEGLTKYRRRPLVITETNPLYLRGSGFSQPGWDADAHAWVERMFDYLQRWNLTPGAQYVHGVCLYRYEGGADPWRIFDKPQILDAFRAKGEIAR